MLSVERYERASRFYEFWSQRDLLGDSVVVIVNGRIGTPQGRIRTIAVSDEVAANEMISTLRKERRAKQYKIKE